MNCSICSKPIVLVPSAAERAQRDVAGHTAQHYINLFQTHSECALQKRKEDIAVLLKRF